LDKLVYDPKKGYVVKPDHKATAPIVQPQYNPMPQQNRRKYQTQREPAEGVSVKSAGGWILSAALAGLIIGIYFLPVVMGR
jgi:hypothetical protein